MPHLEKGLGRKLWEIFKYIDICNAQITWYSIPNIFDPHSLFEYRIALSPKALCLKALSHSKIVGGKSTETRSHLDFIMIIVEEIFVFRWDLKGSNQHCYIEVHQNWWTEIHNRNVTSPMGKWLDLFWDKDIAKATFKTLAASLMNLRLTQAAWKRVLGKRRCCVSFS